MDEDKIMNEITLKGTVFNAKQNGKLTTFRLSFYNGKDKNGAYNPNGFIECKYFDNITFKDKERIVVKGYLACDYWEYQGKKYSQLCIKVTEIERDDKPVMDKAWGENVIQDDGIPF